MKKVLALTVMVFILSAMIMSSTVMADFSVLANPVFSEASVYLGSNMVADFDASTRLVCSTIAVTSCKVQKNINGVWSDVVNLPLPESATDTDSYGASYDYSSKMPTGGSFRIKAVFSGGGESLTRYSNARNR